MSKGKFFVRWIRKCGTVLCVQILIHNCKGKKIFEISHNIFKKKCENTKKNFFLPFYGGIFFNKTYYYR